MMIFKTSMKKKMLVGPLFLSPGKKKKKNGIHPEFSKVDPLLINVGCEFP